MRSTHASFVVNRICLPWRDFVAPSGLQGAARGHKGPQGAHVGGGGGCQRSMQFTRRSVFWGFVLRIVACVFVKEVYACVVGRQHESACYGGIFGPSVGRQRKKQKKCNLLWCAFGGRKIVPASGGRKRSVFLGFVLCVFQIAHRSESAWHGGTFGPFAGRP